MTVDELAQELRRVDGNNTLGAGALAEALMPFLAGVNSHNHPRTNMTSPEKLATPEINHASAETAKVVEQAIGALADILGGWRYIRQSHGDLYGVGWDRCEKSASIAIAALRAEVSRLATQRQTGGEAVAPEAKPTLQDYQDSVMAMFAAVGYTEEYARQWPKEKVSVTFKRWFDEQISRAAAPPAPPAPLPGKRERALFQAWARDRHWNLSLRADGERYMSESTQEGWYAWKGRAALSSPPTLEAAPADYPPLPTNADLGFLADDIREEPVTWSLICDLVRKAIAADRAQRSGVSADPLPDLDVDLPDRVIDQLMHDAGVSLMEPWSEQEMYDFANTVKREVLARVPLKMLAASPQHQVKKGEPS